MEEKEELSDIDRQVIEFVRDFRRQNGAGPTDKQGATHFGWSNGWAFGYRAQKLIERGYLARGEGHRSLYVVGEEPGRSRRLIDVYCPASCGPPQPTDDDAPEQIDLDQVFDPNEVFFVKAKGNSMIDDHIASGDFVAIKKDTEWKSGDTVLVRVDGELTLKKLVQRKSGREVEYWLHPRNKTMKPFRLEPTQHNEIVGVYAGVVRLSKK